MASYVGRTGSFFRSSILFTKASYGEPSKERKRERKRGREKEKEREKGGERKRCLEWPISRVLSFNASSDLVAETSAYKLEGDERRKGSNKKSSERDLRLTGPSGIRQPRYDFVRSPISMRGNAPPRKVAHMLGSKKKFKSHSTQILGLTIFSPSPSLSLLFHI